MTIALDNEDSLCMDPSEFSHEAPEDVAECPKCGELESEDNPLVSVDGDDSDPNVGYFDVVKTRICAKHQQERR